MPGGEREKPVGGVASVILPGLQKCRGPARDSAGQARVWTAAAALWARFTQVAPEAPGQGAAGKIIQSILLLK